MPGPNTTMWTEERRTLVAKLWHDGLPASAMAKHLSTATGTNVTRNAVISIVHRMHLPMRNPAMARSLQAARVPPRTRSSVPKPPPRQYRHRYARLRFAGPDGLPVEPLPDEAHTGPVVALEDLEPHACRWPLGDPKQPGFGFCGARKVTGLPYCAGHAARAFKTPAQAAAEAAEKRRKRIAGQRPKFNFQTPEVISP